MKTYYILLLFFLFLIKEIQSKEDSQEIINKEEEEQNKELEELNKEEEELNKEEEEELNEGEKGGVMTDEEFEEKLQKILEEKHLTKKKKITKDILQQIFEAIYSKDFELPEIPEDSKDEDNANTDSKEETKRFLNEMFYKLARGLDYDDEILVKDIKNWISPSNVKTVVNEMIENLIGMIGNMEGMKNSDL